jgi:hypothetical protein
MLYRSVSERMIVWVFKMAVKFHLTRYASLARSLAGQSSNDHVQSCLDDIFLELTSCFATKESTPAKLL